MFGLTYTGLPQYVNPNMGVLDWPEFVETFCESVEQVPLGPYKDGFLMVEYQIQEQEKKEERENNSKPPEHRNSKVFEQEPDLTRLVIMQQGLAALANLYNERHRECPCGCADQDDCRNPFKNIVNSIDAICVRVGASDGFKRLCCLCSACSIA